MNIQNNLNNLNNLSALNNVHNEEQYADFKDYLTKNNSLIPKNIEQNHLSIPREVIHKMPTELITITVVADSRDRNTDIFPNTNRFQVKGEHTSSSLFYSFEGSLPDDTEKKYFYKQEPSKDTSFETNIKNVVYMKIEECIVPNFTISQPYLVLQIPELKDIIIGTNNNLRNAFCILIPERQFGPPITQDFTYPAWVNCKTMMIYCKKVFDPPLAKLPKITIEFYAPDGTLFDFSTVLSGGDNIYDNTLCVFSICCQKPNKKFLNYDLIP